ncbi:protein sneaky [Tribolium castaneum]|uniref:DC-STAMP domain-containing protein 1-like Protein n=1 Tax=Tribolium castaneum TaxID=7070 RepID=D6X0B8_TRICA|nr:PREDICTED: DC-STAMP domain-containing protein 1 [Tribolium castaneum]EFA10523.1 DC-STAMP domain-containing protein 1-like Protein [Tribolium castaneum]|eukprot:XP_967927.1 PREDICTED: DC-STAMP domain-containing protein 1 [Tribolium castaneum]
MRLCCCNFFKDTLRRSSLLLYKVIFSQKEHTVLKKLFSFFFGVLLGIGFYFLILIDLNFTAGASTTMALAMCLLLGLGNAFSSQIRCITLLTLPSFGGKVGRGVIKTFVLAYILSGPVDNITVNGREVVRVFACTTSLTFNLTKTRFELMFKPFSDALFGMKADVNEVKDTMRSIRDVSAPVVGEVEDAAEMRRMKEENDYMDAKTGDTARSKDLGAKYDAVGEKREAERFEKMYLKKIEMRCEDQFTKAAKNCREMFAKAYDKCYEAVTWVAAWLICWPMKLDFVCNIAQALGGVSRCDPSKDIDPGFGDGYAYLKKSRSQFSDNFKNVRLQYQLPKIKQLIDLRDSRETAKAILHTVNAKKAVLRQLMVILKRILAFIFLRIIMNASTYLDKYLTDIQFDNIYVTTYYRRIDARRRQQGKYTVLPLKKIEKKKLVDPCTPRPLKSEHQQLFWQTVHLLLEVLFATTFILLDRLFYEGLDLVRRHARIDYVQTGRHDMKLEVKGTGMIANLLRSVIKGFNIKKRIHIERSNEKCLPQPSLLPSYYIYKIYGTYFVLWLLILVNMYTQRLRHAICGMFYRKWEKRRILHIYNETLRRRVGFYRFMKKKIQKLVRQRRLQDDLNVFMVLQIKFPRLFRFLQLFPGARRKCLMCKEVEPLCRSKFHVCPNELCHFAYCPECWQDSGQKCLACATLDTDTSSGLDSSDDDAD